MEARAVIGRQHDERTVVETGRLQPRDEIADHAVGVADLEEKALACLIGEQLRA